MHVNKERKAEFADVDLMLFDKLIAFDHLKQKIFLIVNVKTDNLAINYAKAEREIAAMEEILLQPVQPKKPVKAKLGEFTGNQSREQYNKNVLSLQGIYQKRRCLSDCLRAKIQRNL